MVPNCCKNCQCCVRSTVTNNNKGILCSVTRSCPTRQDPMECSCQALLSMGFPRQKYWTTLLFATPGDLPNPGIKPMSVESPALVGGFFISIPPGKPNQGLVLPEMPDWCHLQFLNI